MGRYWIAPWTPNAIVEAVVEAAVISLKKGKSAGVDNIPAELIQAGEEAVTNILTAICNKIWQTGDWRTLWTQSMVVTLPKKATYNCINTTGQTDSSATQEVMLKVILNKLNPQAENIITEEQAGFRAGHGTIKYYNNLSTLESHVKRTCKTYKISTVSLLTSRRHLTGYGMQPNGQP